MKELREILDELESELWVEEISEDENPNIAGMLRLTFIVADKKNVNGRIYPASIIKREITKMKRKLTESSLPGQLNHPISGSTEIDRISHIIVDVNWNDKEKKGLAESAILRTGAGKDLLVLLNSNVKLGASIRGRGSLNAQGIIQTDYELQSIDIVTAPSFGDSVLVSKANLIESGNQFFELEPNLSEEDKLVLRFKFAKEAGCKLNFADWKEKNEEERR
jgi:hypothetical protein